MSNQIIAIDGESASGKSTVAKLVAEHLHFGRLDSGSIYRTMALLCLEEGIKLKKAKSVDFEHNVELCVSANWRRVKWLGGGGLYLDRIFMAGHIYTPRVDEAVPYFAELPCVREVVQVLQHEYVSSVRGDVVADGRDLTTVVFPQAQLKVFVTARLETRARRRFAQYGNVVGLDKIQAALAERDHKDKTRLHSPLVMSPEAHVIQTDGMDQNMVARWIIALWQVSKPREC